MCVPLIKYAELNRRVFNRLLNATSQLIYISLYRGSVRNTDISVALLPAKSTHSSRLSWDDDNVGTAAFSYMILHVLILWKLD